jgi:hypothetical protein
MAISARAKLLAWWTAFTACAILLVAHFSLVELGNLPVNPVQVQFSTIIEPYVHPFFVQNWNFFAPNPIAEDIVVVARVERCTARGKCVTSGWIDVTDPLIDSVRKNRFSSLGMISLMLSNAALEFHNDMLKSPDAKRTIHGRLYLKADIPYTIDPIDAVVVMRTCAAAIRSTNPRIHYEKLQFGLIDYVFPRFSHRNEPDNLNGITVVATSWQPFPNEVAPFTP